MPCSTTSGAPMFGCCQTTPPGYRGAVTFPDMTGFTQFTPLTTVKERTTLWKTYKERIDVYWIKNGVGQFIPATEFQETTQAADDSGDFGAPSVTRSASFGKASNDIADFFPSQESFTVGPTVWTITRVGFNDNGTTFPISRTVRTLSDKREDLVDLAISAVLASPISAIENTSVYVAITGAANLSSSGLPLSTGQVIQGVTFGWRYDFLPGATSSPSVNPTHVKLRCGKAIYSNGSQAKKVAGTHTIEGKPSVTECIGGIGFSSTAILNPSRVDPEETDHLLQLFTYSTVGEAAC